MRERAAGLQARLQALLEEEGALHDLMQHYGQALQPLTLTNTLTLTLTLHPTLTPTLTLQPTLKRARRAPWRRSRARTAVQPAALLVGPPLDELPMPHTRSQKLPKRPSSSSRLSIERTSIPLSLKKVLLVAREHVVGPLALRRRPVASSPTPHCSRPGTSSKFAAAPQALTPCATTARRAQVFSARVLRRPSSSSRPEERCTM